MRRKGVVLKHWSEKDIDILKKYHKKGINFLMKKLPDRSEQAIRTKCCYLKLLTSANSQIVTERLFMVA